MEVWGAGIDIPCVCAKPQALDQLPPEVGEIVLDDGDFDIIAYPGEQIESRVFRIQPNVQVSTVSLPDLAQPFAAVDYESVERSVVAAMPTTPPTIRIIQLAEPQPVAKAAADPTLPVCNFDLTLNEQQINLLHFSSATDLFCRGLYFSWTKDTFLAVAKKHFPGLKCGQDREACMRQIALYLPHFEKPESWGTNEGLHTHRATHPSQHWFSAFYAWRAVLRTRRPNRWSRWRWAIWYWWRYAFLLPWPAW